MMQRRRDNEGADEQIPAINALSLARFALASPLIGATRGGAQCGVDRSNGLTVQVHWIHCCFVDCGGTRVE